VGLDHESGEPLYQQLAALLRDQIQGGELTGRVPSVKSLAQEHGVSHITAERSLAILRDEGLIRAIIGKGHYVVGRSRGA
jgi:DNA-binding GntR family transcriptional regulator